MTKNQKIISSIIYFLTCVILIVYQLTMRRFGQIFDEDFTPLDEYQLRVTIKPYIGNIYGT
ncbi:MAG: hypothetical protein LBT05_00050 [Planctomycetaceae bacterium]|nr:hypothetical protein [Planctomycetaceae bacterium]